MKLIHVFGLAIVAIGSLNAFAKKTDREVIELTAQLVQEAVIANTSLDESSCNRSIHFDEANFTATLKGEAGAVMAGFGGSGSPEGDGSSRAFFKGAILVVAGEAYMTREEIRASKNDRPLKMVLGLKLTIDRDNCKSTELKGTLEIFRNKDNNVVSTTEFKIK